MIKIVEAGSWSGPGMEQPVHLIKVSSRGLIGNDRAEFLKTASHVFADALDDIKLVDGDVPIHLNAIGSTEGYGCFFAGTPVQTYHGFQNIEDVEPGDMVLTHRNRFRPVTCQFLRKYSGPRTTLKVVGLPEPVVATSNHPFLVIAAEEFKTKHRCPSLNQKRPGWTKEAAVRNAAVNKSKFVAAREIRRGDWIVIPVNPVDATAEALPFNLAYAMGVYLAEGCVAYSYAADSIDGDGRSDLPSRMIFSMSKENDPPVLERVRRAAGKYGYLLTVRDSNSSEKGWRVEWNCRQLAQECSALFGAEATEKRIHPSVFAQSCEWKLRFLAGYFDGDGCLTTDSKRARYENVLRSNTASLNLAVDLQRLLASVLIPSSISKGYNRESNGCFGTGDLPIYEVSVGSAYSADIYEHCSRLKPSREVPRKKQATGQTCGDYLLFPVASVEQDQVVGQNIFNLEVEDDNTYVTLIAGHNSNRNADGFSEETCKRAHNTFVTNARLFYNHQNRDQAKSYGVVKLSDYNPRMRRIELLVLGNGTKEAAERNGGLVMKQADIDLLERGELLPVSMATRLAYDVCQNCFNKAASRNFYCDESTCISPSGRRGFGCKSGLTKVAEDGFMQYVDNPWQANLTYFDISRVHRPADRIAYGGMADYLQKAASLDHVPGGAELAELYNVGPGFALLDPVTTLFHRKVAEQVQLCRELAEVERQIESGLTERDYAFARGLNKHGSVCLDTHRPPGRTDVLLGELAKHKVAASLADLVRLSTPRVMHKVLDGVIPKIAQHLPGVFSRLVDLPELEQLVKGSFAWVQTEPPLANLLLRTWAAKQAEGYSFSPEIVGRRVVKSAIHSQEPPKFVAKSAMIKTAAADDEGEQLARHYALYKLAFLGAVQRDEEFNTLKRLVVLQHYLASE